MLRRTLYRWYSRRLRAQLAGGPLPEHIALVMDGNRRWARQAGFDNPSVGHKHGAEHVDEVLAWCADLGIRHVTIYVASTDNLRKRGAPEVDYLMTMIEQVVAERLIQPENQWRLHLAGRLDALPDSTRHALKEAKDTTADRQTDLHLTVAIGYDGHEEIVDAVRGLIDAEASAGTSITELSQRLTPEDIASHLYTSDQPNPELVIRTSGEQRLSSFLLWQAAFSELYFCDVYWPGFRYVDFLRALRTFQARRARSD